MSDKPKAIITVKIQQVPDSTEFYSRAYDSNGLPLMGPDWRGQPYHLGHISSSVQWATYDMQNHFARQFDRLYPEGWELVFLKP
jgi:hypothetical protein